jgi:cell wall-associated NlpC family hydrolase
MLTEIARTWLNTKWVHCQSNKGVGCDCVGFLFGVAKEANLGLPSLPKAYARLPKQDDIKKYLDANFDGITAIEADSILLLEFQGIRCHVAIATSNNTMIHADSMAGSVIEHRIDEMWLRKIKYIYRIKQESYNNA